MEGMREEKLYSPFLQSGNVKSPVQGEVSHLILSPIVASWPLLPRVSYSSVVRHLDSGMATSLLFFYINVNQPLMRRFQLEILLNSEDAIEASRAN